MWTKNKTGFKNTLEFPKNDFKERSPELLREKNEHSPRKKSKKGTLMTNLKLAWRNSHENYFSKHKNSLRFDCHEAQGSKWPGTRTEEKVLKPERTRICAKDSVHAHIINREKLLDQRERCAIWRQNRVLNILDSELSLSPSRNSRKSKSFCRKQVRSCDQQEKM